MSARLTAPYVSAFCRFTTHETCPAVIRHGSQDGRATNCTCGCHTDPPAVLVEGKPGTAGGTINAYWGI